MSVAQPLAPGDTLSPEISVVVPVYGCEGAVAELHRRLVDALEPLAVPFELVFVEDAGPDRSWERISEIAAEDPRVGAYRLTRNFGQHAAISAGLAEARGEYIVVMDCDLQDPPELIPELYARAKEGYDVVWARQSQKRTSPVRERLGRLYYGGLAKIANVHIDPHQGTFSLISRRVVTAVAAMRDVDRNYVFQLSWLGFPETVVTYDRDERFEGESSYTFRALVRHAVSGLVFQTTALLHWVIYAGFLCAFAGMAAAIYLVIAKLTGHLAPGWTSLAVFTLLVGGVVILSTGVTGLYVGKIFDQVRGRPLWVFEDARPATVSPAEPPAAATRPPAETLLDR
jgi:glycosyltransferase involved in cell wall biosynthesis